MKQTNALSKYFPKTNLLNKWVQKHQHDDLMSGPHEDVAKENERLRKEVRLLREERGVLKTVPGSGSPVRGRNSLCYRCEMKGSGRSLIGGLSWGRTPLKTWSMG